MQQSWRVFRFKGTPVRLHFSVLFLIPLSFLFSGQTQLVYAPVFAVFVIALLLAHELGHAIVAKMVGVRVYQIEVLLLFGTCRTAAPHSRRAEIFIAWGGVLAQMLVLIIALVVVENAPALLKVNGLRPHAYGVLHLSSHVFIGMNVVMMAINLVPAKGLDGHIAWKILSYLRNGTFFRHKTRKFKKGVIAERQRKEERAKNTTRKIIASLTRKKPELRLIEGGQ